MTRRGGRLLSVAVRALDAAMPFDFEAKMQARIAKERQMTIGIVGFGNFGQFLAKRFITHGHRVIGFSRGDYFDKAREIGAEFFNDADDFCEEHPDVVILATSIISTEQVLRSIPLQRLKRNTLFVDVLSVKEFPKKLMLKVHLRSACSTPRMSAPCRNVAHVSEPLNPHPPPPTPFSLPLQLLPSYFDILCLHPMFGPDSGRGSWANLPLVYDRVRVHPEKRREDRCNAFLAFWEIEGCRCVPCGRTDE